MGFTVLMVLLFAVANPPTTPYMWAQSRKMGGVDQAWVPIEEISPYMMRSVVAAEDANFCLHWGFDMSAIRDALAAGAWRGGSTISQQTVKNVYLWQGRSWVRKALEAALTPMVEIVWSKRRILEVYLNVVEFGEGIFGIDAAAFYYFRTTPAELTAYQAAALAMVLPSPKERSASAPSSAQQRRVARIRDGAATIRSDGRAACFEG
ncbi:MAG: monofunctional biosynthetic peptidoglycan transglycosylase [Halocynthiibacter sp.]